jgi:hypothetical protein
MRLERGHKTPEPCLYTLSKALAISPLEIMKMPASMVMDFLYIHRNFEELKADTIEQEMKKVKK